jgi:hypothetical protein
MTRDAEARGGGGGGGGDARRRAFKAAAMRWHPDKFSQRYGARVGVRGGGGGGGATDGDDDATATEEGAVVMERVKATYQSIREAFDRGW